MTTVRIALANLAYPTAADESVVLAERGIRDAAAGGAEIVCFPECFVPGYPLGAHAAPPDPAFLARAWASIASAAATARIAVVLGTERVVEGARRLTALVIDRDGAIAGWQDKVQLDPSEDGTYAPGSGREAENTIFFATVNCASEGSPTTSAVAKPDGTLLCAQPYGEAGILFADLDLSLATGLLASRCRTC